MEIKPIRSLQDTLQWEGWTVCLVPNEEDGRFRLFDLNDQPIGEPQYEGSEIRVKDMPCSLAQELPWQPHLLDKHLPPYPNRPNVWSSGRYLIRLALTEGGSVITRGYFEEFRPETTRSVA